MFSLSVSVLLVLSAHFLHVFLEHGVLDHSHQHGVFREDVYNSDISVGLKKVQIFFDDSDDDDDENETIFPTSIQVISN